MNPYAFKATDSRALVVMRAVFAATTVVSLASLLGSLLTRVGFDFKPLWIWYVTCIWLYVQCTYTFLSMHKQMRRVPVKAVAEVDRERSHIDSGDPTGYGETLAGIALKVRDEAFAPVGRTDRSWERCD